MSHRWVLSLSIFAILAIPASALDVRLREFRSTPLSQPDQDSTRDVPRPPVKIDIRADADTPPGDPDSFRVYPVAGTIGRDVAIPYYVDLDPSSVKRDFNCSDLTFNGHAGHDPYIRSFAEQEIGVPVFAARDGVVIDLRDGEPDQNTTNDPSFRTNYLTIRHSDDQISQYVHVKRNSISVAKGDFVTAGTQVALIGSSGPSTAPHLHFEGRWGDTAYEPLAGPCRAGRTFFDETPPMNGHPMILGAMFSATSFEGIRPAPWADATPTGTFAKGPQTIYFRTELANVGMTTTYTLSLSQPSGVTANISSGHLTNYDASLASAWWGIDVNLDRTGTWKLKLDIDGDKSFEMPFTVVDLPSQVVNRTPNTPTAAIEPIGLRAGDVPVCRASFAALPDPDYDVVRYHYEWRVNGVVVREVTTAAQSDAIGRQFATARAAVSCTVTASDGELAAQPAVANAVVLPSVKRRAVGK